MHMYTYDPPPHTRPASPRPAHDGTTTRTQHNIDDVLSHVEALLAIIREKQFMYETRDQYVMKEVAEAKKEGKCPCCSIELTTEQFAKLQEVCVCLSCVSVCVCEREREEVA
jgi:hypothetical protein